ncbi:signal peptidase II [Patescibacteria group bacterium]|nr:signal peptidase II [Patescibacteria group bacterium]MBU1931694.1 signal peptidase II [Patescibacteria group bacterium]
MIDALLSLLLVAADQFSKQFALNQQWPVFYNQRAIFGLVSHFELVQLLALLVLFVWFVFRLKQTRPLGSIERLGWIMIISGIMSNWLDRLRWGAVVDFIDLKIWPVFNLADGLIVGGLTLIFLCSLK